MSTIPHQLLRKRKYHLIIEAGEKPRFRDVFPEWLDTFNLARHREASTTILWTLHHVIGLAMGVLFFTHYLSATNLLWLLGFTLIHAHFFHTFWYHRFCSHRAFRFRQQWFPKLIYWLNPLFIKEESYVVPHFVHHQISDTPGDPYGPGNGYWGSFSATESANFLNRSMPAREFNFCQKFLSHIPTKWHTQEDFQRTGSIETFWRYPLRFLVCYGFWTTLFLALGRPDLLCAFSFGTLIFLLIMRDFNFRGHDEDSDLESKLDRHSLAANQWIYGILASEWHDNHHRFASSAKAGFLKRELDISFAITKVLSKLGIIESYVDSSKGYEREIIRIRERKTAA